MKLLFISYINRSGSTYLINEFSKFDSVLVCPEAEVLFYYLIKRKDPLYLQKEKFVKLFGDLFRTDFKLRHWNLDIADLEPYNNYTSNFQIFVDILNKYRRKVKPEASIIVFKTDILAYYLRNISFEDIEKYSVKTVLLMRDGRASYASQRRTRGARTKKPMNRNPVKAAELWKTWVEFNIFTEDNPHYITVKYEQLITNFEKTFDHLINNLDIADGIGEKKNKGDLYHRIPEEQTAMHFNIEKEPLHDNIEKWKLTLPISHIAIFERIAGKQLRLMNYELLNPYSLNIKVTILHFAYRLSYKLGKNTLYRKIRRTISFLYKFINKP